MRVHPACVLSLSWEVCFVHDTPWSRIKRGQSCHAQPACRPQAQARIGGTGLLQQFRSSSFQDATATFLEQTERVPLSCVASLLPMRGDISEQQWYWACLLPLESQAATAPFRGPPSLLRAALCLLALASDMGWQGRVGKELPPSTLYLLSNEMEPTQLLGVRVPGTATLPPPPHPNMSGLLPSSWSCLARAT